MRGFEKKLRLPPGYAAPTELAYDDIVATAITRADLHDDVRGINASIALIQRTRGGNWPTARPSRDQVSQEERASERPSGVAGWAAYAACTWSVVFVAPHVYWAAGGTAGLPNGEPLQGAIAVVNYAAIALSALAAALALALARPGSTAVPRPVLLAAAWAACVVLALRGAGGLAQGLFDGVQASEPGSGALVIGFEVLFLVGGILFGLAARAYARSNSAAGR